MRYSFTVIEYHPARPWIALDRSHEDVELADDQDFRGWARERWPGPRYRVDLDSKLKPWNP